MENLESLNSIADLRDEIILNATSFLKCSTFNLNDEEIYNISTKFALKTILESLYFYQYQRKYREIFTEDIYIQFLCNHIQISEKQLNTFFMNIDFNLNDNVIALMYEQSQNKLIRKALGQYFTPNEFIDKILNIIHFSPDLKVLEPSFGGGSFLSHIISKLKECYSLKDVQKFIAENLYGCDIDPNCIEIGDIHLSLITGSNKEVKSNLICNDFLKQRFTEKFDIIIGNPPYNAKLEPKTLAQMKKEFPYFLSNDVEGKKTTNSAALFLIKALKLLKPNGKLAFIIPNSFMRVKEYEKLRNHIIHNYNVTHIFNIGKAFKDAGLEMVIIIIENVLPTDEPVSIYSTPYQKNALKIEKMLLSRWGIFPLFLNKASAKVAEKIEHNTVLLQSIMKMPRGIAISAKSPKIIRYTDNKTVYPILRGKDIGPLHLKNNEYAISNIDCSAANVIQQCVLVQNIAIRIVATLNVSKSVPLDTLNKLTFIDSERNSINELAYIAGILNSKLINFYFQNVINNRSRLTIHMDEPYLGKIPIKQPFSQLISTTAQQLFDLNNQLNAFEPNALITLSFETLDELDIIIKDANTQIEKLKTEIKKKDHKLNELVYLHYEMLPSEIIIIEENQGTNPIREKNLNTKFKSFLKENKKYIPSKKFDILKEYFKLN